jgi:hypothetical protein
LDVEQYNRADEPPYRTDPSDPDEIVGKREILAALYPQSNPASQHDYHQR